MDRSEEVRGTVPALVLFADVVDSSKYSAVLGYTEYAKRLLRFQQLFRVVGARYFPEPEDLTQEFCRVNARGDEGTVFLARMSGGFAEPLMRAIEFLYHLKGLLRFGFDEGLDAPSPRDFGVGAGIHVGQVAYLTQIKDSRSIISGLEGFSINYAKRVESASRLGKHSRIFLSRDASKLLEDKPIVLSPVSAAMKGIEESADLYEVRAGLLSGLQLQPNEENPQEENMIECVQGLMQQPEKIEEPWMKSLAISVTDWLLRESPVAGRKAEYRESQLRLAWHSSIEDDPILLYVRAREFEEKKEYSQQLRYLKEILDKYPDFVHARKRLIRACSAIAKSKAQRAEMVLARDLAKEFLEKFPSLLGDDERKELQDVVGLMKKKTER